MAIVPFNHYQKEYHAVEQMLENHSNAAVVHPMGTNKSMIDGELAEAPQDVSFRWFSHSADIFKTSCESVRRNSPEKDLFWTALFTYVKRLRCSRQERETMAAQKSDFIILNALHRVCVSHRNVPVKSLLALRPQTKLLGLTATAIRYLDAQKNRVEHFFGNCIANEMTLGEEISFGDFCLPISMGRRYFSIGISLELTSVVFMRRNTEICRHLSSAYLPAGWSWGRGPAIRSSPARRSTSRHRPTRTVLHSWTKPV